jgi:regulator of protease activity HflC (stomatin/prohibitin superfamily)
VDYKQQHINITPKLAKDKEGKKMNLIMTILIVLLVIFLFLFFFFLYSVSVPDYMAARHYRFGKPLTKSPISGNRIIVIPYIDQVVMIDKRIQKSTIENISILTKERQMMTLSVTLIWKTTNAATTIENIRPEDIEPTFFKIAESVIKNESSKMNVSEILENRTVLSKNLLIILSETTDTWGITVSSVNISNLSVISENFMKNLTMPMQIELERKTKLAQIEKDLIIELKTIENAKQSELLKLESEKTLGIKREEIFTELERAKKEREILIANNQSKLEQINSEISLIQQGTVTKAESEKIKCMILAETEGLKEKLKVINLYSSNALSYEITKILPELYKNIKIGDITLFEGTNSQNNGIDFLSFIATSALTLMKKTTNNIQDANISNNEEPTDTTVNQT